jgi:hypothetical protein
VSQHDVIYVINLVTLILCSAGENSKNVIVVTIIVTAGFFSLVRVLWRLQSYS